MRQAFSKVTGGKSTTGAATASTSNSGGSGIRRGETPTISVLSPNTWSSDGGNTGGHVDNMTTPQPTAKSSFTFNTPGNTASSSTAEVSAVGNKDDDDALLEGFRSKVRRLAREEKNAGALGGFTAEYEDARRGSATPQARERVTSSTRHTRQRNRYNNVLCYDDTRVRVQGFDNDYINASTISGDHEHDPDDANYEGGGGGGAGYIAAQAPVPGTIGMFWQMCWLQRVPVVLMLTPFEEVRPGGASRPKADKYFPEVVVGDDDDDVAVVAMESEQEASGADIFSNRAVIQMDGGVQVSCLSLTRPFSGCTKRVLELVRDGDTANARRVAHIHLTSWPDFGSMDELDNVLHLFDVVDECHVQMTNTTTAAAVEEEANGATETSALMPNRGPILVHCSAGIGRTGTYIAIDLLRKRIAAQLKMRQPVSVDVAATVTSLRLQRPGMVQTAGQFGMIYHVLDHMFRSGSSARVGKDNRHLTYSL